MSLLQMSVAGAVMIMVITVIRALAINRLPKKTFLILWGITIIRLLIPFSCPSKFSIYSLLGKKTVSDINETPAVRFMPINTQRACLHPGTSISDSCSHDFSVGYHLGGRTCSLRGIFYLGIYQMLQGISDIITS